MTNITQSMFNRNLDSGGKELVEFYKLAVLVISERYPQYNIAMRLAMDWEGLLDLSVAGPLDLQREIDVVCMQLMRDNAQESK